MAVSALADSRSLLSSSPVKATGWLVGVIALLHLAAAGGVGLSVDEAHYAMFGRLLDWSYFDHPPMVGWLQALILPFSESEWALRLWPILLSAAASAALYLLARRLFPDQPWSGFAAVAVFQSGLMVQLLGIAMIPDTPLLLFGMLAALALHRALVDGEVRAWLWVGLWFGLAGLSKYTAVTLVVSALVLVVRFRAWRHFTTPWPWLGALVALAAITPVLWWNYQHEWLSFAYQAGHGLPDRQWDGGRFLLSQAGQFLAYSPGLFIGAVLATVAAFRRGLSDGEAFSLALAAPVIVLFGWSSGFNAVLPHWTAFGWQALAPLVGYWFLTRWQRRPVRWLAGFSAVWSAVFILVLHTEFMHPWLPYEENRHPLADLHGWPLAAERALELRDGMSGEGGADPILFASNWSYASLLAWYARPATVQVVDDRFTQQDLWFGSPQPGAGGVLVVPQFFNGSPVQNGTERFTRCELAETVAAPLRQRTATSYYLYRCSGYRR